MAVTLCTNFEVVRKVGTNVSASGGSVDFTTDFINQAEGYICNRCRYDFITNYVGLSNHIKYLLRLAVSNLAAMYAIQYDMSGYTTRAFAETMLDVLRDGFVKAMETLENINVKEFMGVA